MRGTKKEITIKAGEKITEGLAQTAVKLGEMAMGKCGFVLLYEPKIPMELLKESMDK